MYTTGHELLALSEKNIENGNVPIHLDSGEIMYNTFTLWKMQNKKNP